MRHAKGAVHRAGMDGAGIARHVGGGDSVRMRGARHGRGLDRAEGQGRIIFSPTLTFARQRFDRRGRPAAIDRFVKSESTTVIEYGWREDVTLMLRTRQRIESFS